MQDLMEQMQTLRRKLNDAIKLKDASKGGPKWKLKKSSMICAL